MNIYVLLKRTFDSEEKITVKAGRIDESGAEYIINPYDEYAIEEAIVLRDAHGGTVTVVTIGDEEADKQLRTALAMGADEAVLINDEEVDPLDQHATAHVLATYLADKDAQIILAGNVTIDGGSGQIGPRVATLLNIPYVTTVTNVVIEGNRAVLARDSEGDIETIETTLPLLITTQQGLNEPRYPSLPGIMKAKKKPLEELEVEDLVLQAEQLTAKVKIIDVTLPPKKEAGRIIEGDIKQQVEALANILQAKGTA